MRYLLVSLLIIVGLNLCSCSIFTVVNSDKRPEGLKTDMMKSDEQKADYCFEAVITTIENQDRDDLKSMFSKTALAQADDFEEHMDYLLGFFQGEVDTWERVVCSSDESIENGEKIEMIRSWYTVTTDMDVYMFFLLEQTIDNTNSDNVGLYALRVIKAEDEETQFTDWQDMSIAGIYKP